MVNFTVGTRHQIRDWHSRGVIDNAMVEKLEADLDRQKSSRSFSSIAVILGVICLCFGAMTFVAANWEEMSRLMRLVILTTSIIASFVISAAFEQNGKAAFAQSFVLLACGCFGATVMLVGQMYHLPGHASGAVLLWSLGTLAAAVFVRSIPALILATILVTLWSCWFMVDERSFEGIHFWYLPLWGICAALAWYLKSRFAAHVAALGLHVWFLFTLVENFDDNSFPITAAICIALAVLLISTLLWSHDNKGLLRDFELSGVFHLALFSLVQLGLWYGAQFDRNWFRIENLGVLFTETPFGIIVLAVVVLSLVFWRTGNGKSRFDHIACTLLIILAMLVLALSAIDFPFALEAFSLVFTIWMIRMGTRQESLSVTRLGYIGFIIAMLLIYAEAAGGLLGTSLFYIIAGLLLVAGALLAPKISGRKQVIKELANE
ncbi:MAG: DUF2157 domain-containing protein [Pseudomonadota bacterium]